jgi:hypothetical protein
VTYLEPGVGVCDQGTVTIGPRSFEWVGRYFEVRRIIVVCSAVSMACIVLMPLCDPFELTGSITRLTYASGRYIIDLNMCGWVMLSGSV